jgi:hypothetical protein
MLQTDEKVVGLLSALLDGIRDIRVLDARL